MKNKLFRKLFYFALALFAFDSYAFADINLNFDLRNEVANENIEKIIEFINTALTSINEDIDREQTLTGNQLSTLAKIKAIYQFTDRRFVEEALHTNKAIEQLKIKLYRYILWSPIYENFYHEAQLRRFFNDRDSSYKMNKNYFKHIFDNLLAKKSLRDLRNEVSIFQNDATIKKLSNRIELIKDSKWSKLRRKLFFYKIGDLTDTSSNEVVHFLSRIFGNSAGAVKWRRGYLDQNLKINSEIQSIARPLDIITEKVRYALTDTFIPGHFGHNAIYLGSKEQLKEIGIWDDPIISVFHEQIEDGLVILETDRSGTHLKSLSDFMNVDEFALLRFKKNIFSFREDKELVKNIYKVALSQLGKSYDFNFDVETTDQLVCSELLYQSFGMIHWPVEPYLGRMTISPDNVVSLAIYDNAPMELLYYVRGYKDGVIETKDLDDLATDLNYVKEQGQYLRPIKECHYENERDSRGDFKRKRTCITRYESLVYSSD